MIWPVYLEQDGLWWTARCRGTTPVCRKPHTLARTKSRQPAQRAADEHLKHLNQISAFMEGIA
ncbi:hypothetical protein [Actinomadura harenae]|uniref:Uncharacterized protein n=1 Tax=Actinomadura harenae TaxID=2483351 RepID=A0A3M2MDF7_9ACTN|nr:hypothetical protein [Actinomadura harenae]RMI47582.1 hypothetical protein EBO15_01390 [Actinomadura harenae]